MNREICVQQICKSYGKVRALQSVTFHVKEGELFGLIGPDGSGKTSLFRILTTLLLADSGTATVCGLDVVRDYRQIRWHVGYMPGRFSLYPDLTVEENLNFFATLFHTTVRENYGLIRDIYQQIEPFKHRKAGALSGGMKQKLVLSCALIHRPDILFLDEPTTGVDPVSRIEFWNMLDRLRAEESNVEWLVALREHKPLTSLAGDSVDIWAWQPIYQLSGMPMDNRVTFTFPSDSNFKARDTLRWSVRFTFAAADTCDSLHAPVMALQMRFANDSVIGDYVQVREEGRRMLTLTSDTLGDIKEVSGFVYYPRPDSVGPLVLDGISLMRYHARGVDSLALAQDSLATDTLAKDKSKEVKQQAKPVKTETVEEPKPKKEEPRRLSPSEMRRSQGTQEQTRKKGTEPRKRQVNAPQPATRLKQNVKLRKVDE